MYLKISKNQIKQENSYNLYSLKLEQNEKIIGVDALNDSDILIKITDSKNTYAIIYNIKKNSVESIIKK